MNDFLEFLNTADLDTFTKIYGVPRPIAGNIIAARPFDIVEDCLQAKGVTKKLLAHIQSTFDVETSMSGSRAMITVDDGAAHLEQGQARGSSSSDKKPSVFAGVGRAFEVFIKALIRLVALLVLIAAIGALIYFGLPIVRDRLIVPIDRNTANINRLENEITDLQSQLDITKARVETLQKSIEAHSASLSKLDEIQSTLESEIQTKQDETLLDLKHEVMMTRALDMLGRARLYLAQSNFGLAKEDVQAARGLLAKLQTETGNTTISQALPRLDLALGNLPEFPVVASGDLEIAWQILMAGPPSNIVTLTPTLTAMPVPSSTSQPTLITAPTSTP